MRKTIVAVGLFLAATSCRGNERAGTSGETGGTLIVSVATDAGSIFPPHVTDALGAAVRDQLYDRLADLGDDMNTIGDKDFTPRLADRWDWSADSLSIAFHVDPKARWHDGTPVRANDVRYSYRVFSDPKVGSSVAPTIVNVDSVSVRDSLTAVVWYKSRRPEQFYDFVYQVYVLPEHMFKDVPGEQLRTSELARRGIGSGRFRLARWDAGQRIELIADTANYRGRAKLDRAVWSIAPDAGAAMAQLLSGRADMLELVPPDQIARVDSNPAVHTVPYPAFQYAFMGMNSVDPARPSQPHPIFGDARVRRAVSMALDRRAMLQNVYGRIGKLSRGPFPSSIAFADTTLQLPPYDVNQAETLLDSAGWRRPAAGSTRQKNGKPLRFAITVPVSSRIRMAYAVLIQEQLAKVGIQAELDQLQPNVMLERMFAHKFDAALIAQFTDPSPSGYRQQWGSEGATQGGQNYVWYRNPAYDALVDSALSTSDAGKMKAHMRRAFQIQIQDAPAVWLYDVQNIAAIHRRFQIQPMRADGWWGHLADWTIPPGARIDRDRIGLTPAR
jgi:peptide/nickel transport system substrate-binding protein